MSPVSIHSGPAASGPGAPRAFRACPVCGCGALHTDEVFDREGVGLLTECPRCEHRVFERFAAVPRAPLRAGWRGAEARSATA
jgi:hypothetical protein